MAAGEELISFWQWPSFDVVFYYVELGIIFALIIGSIFWLFNRMQYKYLVSVYTRRDDKNFSFMVDHAKVVTYKGGIKKLYLKKLRKKIELVDFKNITTGSGFMVKGALALYRYGEDSFAVLKPRDIVQTDNPGLVLDPIENDVSEMCSLMDEVDQKLDKSTFWSTYGPILVQIAFFIILVIAIAILMKGVREVSQANLEATRMLTEILKKSATGVAQDIPSILPGLG